MTKGMRFLLPGVLNLTMAVMCARMVLKGYPLPVAVTTFAVSALIGNSLLYLAIFLIRKGRSTPGNL